VKYSAIVLIIGAPTPGHTMQPAMKKRKIEASCEQSLVVQAILPHLPTVLTHIIHAYCSAPYFFAQYINAEHEKEGEMITDTSIAPCEDSIVTFGFNAERKAHSVRLYDGPAGKTFDLSSILDKQQPQGIAWGRYSNKVIMARSDGKILYMPAVSEVSQDPQAYNPAYRAFGDKEYYCLHALRSYIQNSEPIGIKVCINADKIEPIIPLHHITPRQVDKKNSNPKQTDKIAFTLNQDHFISFQAHAQTVSTYAEGDTLIRTLANITAVDFSKHNPVVGDINGRVKILATNSYTPEILTISAFDNMPVDLVATDEFAIAAVAKNK